MSSPSVKICINGLCQATTTLEWKKGCPMKLGDSNLKGRDKFLLKENIEAQAKKLMQRKEQVEELKDRERVANENVKMASDCIGPEFEKTVAEIPDFLYLCVTRLQI